MLWTDPTRQLKELYTSPRTPVIVEVPELPFVMIDGHGDPNTVAEFKDAVEAVYALSYALKFALKKEQGLEYRVGFLESLWWAEDMAVFSMGRKADWNWTVMIAQPDAVTPERFAQVREEVARKKQLPALAKARLERFNEGLGTQILHIGPFGAEGPTIEALHGFIREQGFTFDGQKHKHHEIYLSDPRRAAPERWKTIIRQPVSEAGG